jgi:hypothetical protein
MQDWQKKLSSFFRSFAGSRASRGLPEQNARDPGVNVPAGSTVPADKSPDKSVAEDGPVSVGQTIAPSEQTPSPSDELEPIQDSSVAVDLAEGTLEVVDRESISGWAWHFSQPNSPARVDIFADGELIMEGVLANEFRQDLLDAGKGNGKHAFAAATPESLLDGKSRQISAKVWGSHIELSESPQTLTGQNTA